MYNRLKTIKQAKYNHFAMPTPILNGNYQVFIKDLTPRIRAAQYTALKAVNHELLMLYWYIGQQLVEKQRSLGWGKSVVEQLAKDIQTEFSGISGFSARNLWLMKQFYELYSQSQFLQPLVAEIGWSHHIQIMSKCKDDRAKEFYTLMTKKFGWTKDVLIHQIDNKSYEKYLLNQTNFDETVSEIYRNQAILAVKDDYQFDFLELANKHSERELELAILNNIRQFLTEMGGYFSFIGSQYRLEVGNQEYKIDLLLFHRKLRCLVAIELKIGEFTPEMAGKMQFYLSVLNDTVREADENPSIGIIICKSKNRTIVEYALKDATKPIGVATYTIDSKLPDNLLSLLPSAVLLEKHFVLIDNMRK
jgi:predicted nuclease of restriction endonuclease-like (RecB) superfamily